MTTETKINLKEKVTMELTIDEIGILRRAIFSLLDEEKKKASDYYKSVKRYEDQDEDGFYKKWYENHSDLFFRADQLREDFQDQFREIKGFSSYDIPLYKNADSE